MIVSIDCRIENDIVECSSCSVWSFAKKIDETVVLKGSGPIGSKGN